MNYIYQLSTNKNLTLTIILVINYVFMKGKKIHKETVIMTGKL